MKAIFEEQQNAKTTRDAAKLLRDATFPAGLLSETGSEAWAELWEAARRFSENGAYPDQPFPFTEEEARCVLCQQDLHADAIARLKKFETFIVSVAEKNFREARDKYSGLYKGLDELKVQTDTIDETVRELRIESESLADEVDAALAAAETRRVTVVSELKLKSEMPDDLPAFLSVGEKIEQLAKQLDLRVSRIAKKPR